jgi:putative transposase
MKYNPTLHNRQSIRLKGYDYAQAGLYFITICVQARELLFGEIENDEMILNRAGQMIQTEWENLPQRFSNIESHDFTVMPNHFHAILEIVGAPLVGAQNGMPAQNHHAQENDMSAQNNPFAENKPVAQNHDAEGAATRAAPTGTGNKTETVQPPVGALLVGALNDFPAQNQTTADTNHQIPTGKTVGDMVAAFKSITTVQYIHGVKNSGWQPFNGKLWQRNYYEHIIRNEHSYDNISGYIIDNPAQWASDKFYRI